MKEGDVYGYLTVDKLYRKPQKSNPNRFDRVADCSCSCGSKTTVKQQNLKSGNTKSCGCMQRAAIGNISRKHGLSNSTEFNTWRGMIERCTNINHKNYSDYGGRGIEVCNEWKESFERFYSDMGSKPSAEHSIERVDNNGNYEPGNCIWATKSAQLENRRRYSNNQSGVTGVGWNKSYGKWRARINHQGKTIELGWYDDFDSACEARKQAEAKYRGRN